jgi:hypothetical protein
MSMSKIVRDYLENVLIAIGMPKKVHDSYKDVELDRSRKVSAVLYYKSETTPDGSKSKFTNDEGITVKRINKCVVKTKYTVVIADTDSVKCDELKDAFLQNIGKGLDDGNGNWVYVRVLDADFEEKKDSVLKGKAAAYLLVECEYGIYEDVTYIPINGLNLTI